MARTLGSKNKPKQVRRLTRERMAELADGSDPLNQSEKAWVKRFQKLSPTEAVRRRMDLEPKERPSPQDRTVNVKFIVRGLPGVCPHCGGVIPAEDSGAPPRADVLPETNPPPTPGPTDSRAPRVFRQTEEELAAEAFRKEQDALREELRQRLEDARREAEEATRMADWNKPL